MQGRQKPDFIVEFLEVFDCPGADGRSKSNIYLRAVLWKYQTIVIRQGPPVTKPECISDIVVTPIRLDCRTAVFNCYRNLHSNPPQDAVLVVQAFHATSDTPKPEMDTFLGKTEIPLAYLQTEEAFTHPLIPIRSSDRTSCLNFSVKLRRAFISGPPPKRKTFFLVRHGQSKWNLAQSKINIAGMLDRDHALTELGIRQAQQLNSRWRFHFFKEGENFTTDINSKAAAKKDTPIKSGNSSTTQSTTPPTADLLDLASFETALPSKKDSSSNFPDDPFADVFGDMTTVSSLPSVPTDNQDTPLLSVPPEINAAEWSKDDVRQHLLRLDSTMEETPDDYHASNFDGDADLIDDDEDAAFSQRPNIADEFATGIPIPQASKVELADKFNHADVKLIDEQSGRVNQDLVEQRRQEYMNLFLHADAIYSSPLTRALQTAVLTMNGHPATKTYGISLYSIIREVKRIGGLDTVGIAVGEHIENRLRSELASILGAEDADRLVSFPIDINDANQPWWTPIADHETDQQQQDRVREFITFLRHCDAQIPVFVGHSLFFRAFYSKRVSAHLLKNRRKLSENLKKFLLSNATMLAVTVNFTDYTLGGGLSEAIMIDADIIFGGGFHGAEHDPDGKSTQEVKSGFGATKSTKDSITGFIAGISQKALGSGGILGGNSIGGGGISSKPINNNSNATTPNSSSTASREGTNSSVYTNPTRATENGRSGSGDIFAFFSNDTQKQWQKELETGRQAASITMKKWSSAVKDFLDS